MNAVYNEIDPFAGAWLESLERAGHVAPGRVERRSIAELTPADVAGPGQRHFFAGIGVWSYALRLAGIPDDTDIWTGSCPCQPFSGAGKRGGIADERHLWPAWFKLIRECRPATVFGEQVASPDGLAWFDAVSADLEGAGYTVGAADLCAAGVGAPHIRQRLYFVAYAMCAGRSEGRSGTGSRPTSGCGAGEALAKCGRVGNTDRDERKRRECVHLQPRGPLLAGLDAGGSGSCGRMGDAGRDGDPEHDGELRRDEGEREVRASHGDHTSVAASAARHPWRDTEWVACTDGKSRPVEPGTFPLAHGAARRVGRLRGYGNAIVAELAATFIEAAEAARGDVTR